MKIHFVWKKKGMVQGVIESKLEIFGFSNMIEKLV